jgi:dolichol-phosphate mannosyltransferase
MQNQKVSFVIPAYNEEGNLASLLNAIIELGNKEKWDYEIVISDDNSSDSTGKIADNYSSKNNRVTVIHRPKGNNGMGAALIEGSIKAKKDIIIWTMGDKSDDISTYPRLIDKINQGYDMVFAARYIKGGSRGNLDVFKASLSSGYTRLARLVFGIKVHDITNAFRAFRKNVLLESKPLSKDFAISPEFAIKAHLKGFRLGEVPTTYTNREKGKSKFKILKMGIRYLSLLGIRIKR